MSDNAPTTVQQQDQTSQKSTLRVRRLSIWTQVMGLVAVVSIPLLLALFLEVSDRSQERATLAQGAAARLSLAESDDAAAMVRRVAALAESIARRPVETLLTAQSCDETLSRPTELEPLANLIVVRDRTGRPVCPLAPAGRNFTSLEAVAWHENVLRSGATAVGPPSVNMLSGRWIVPVVAAVRVKSGEVVGSVAISLDLASIKPVAGNALPVGADGFVVDEQGIVILSWSSLHKPGDAMAADQVVQQALAKRVGTANLAGRDGVLRMHSFSPVGGTTWIAIVGAPPPMETSSSWLRALVVSVPLTLLGLIGAILIGGRIERPIRDVVAAADAAIEGKAFRPIPVTGSRETAALAEKFNAMQAARQDSDNRLAERESQLRSLTLLYAQYFWETDADARIIKIEGAIDSAFTPVVRALKGATLWSSSFRDTPSFTWERLQSTFTARERFTECIAEYRAVNGEKYFLAIAGEPYFDERGEFLGYRGIARDVSTRKRIEASMQLLDASVRNAQDGILILAGPSAAEPGSIRFANPAFCKLTGYSLDELVGKDSALFNGPETDLAMLEHVRGRLAAGEALAIELVRYRKYGDPFWADMRVSPLINERNRIDHVVVVMRDITERRHRELELKHLADTLEQRVSERTTQLEIAARELEAFSYSVSHDLRAPLRVIEGFTDILIEDYGSTLDQIGRDHLQRLKSAAARTNNMINALISMAKISGGELVREPVNLSKLSEEICNDLTHQDPARHARFVIAPSVRVEGDRTLLRMVLENLLGNAWKFSAKVGQSIIELGVDTTHSDGAGGEVYFVRDNGAGFDMRYADRLFGVFQRLHGTNEFQGTGIGLATVARIIQRHGGRIWAEGIVGEGATFYFTLWTGTTGTDSAVSSPLNNTANDGMAAASRTSFKAANDS
jgi:PAS domain S-box-containing protein